MRIALDQAQNAWLVGEVPVGAVIVCKNQIIARGHNLTEQLTDVTAHAEIQAITAAAQYLGAKYLKECTLFVTLEPCCMCAGALYWSQVDRVVFAARDAKRGASATGTSLYHPATLVENGVMETECSQLLKDFYARKR